MQSPKEKKLQVGYEAKHISKDMVCIYLETQYSHIYTR